MKHPLAHLFLFTRRKPAPKARYLSRANRRDRPPVTRALVAAWRARAEERAGRKQREEVAAALKNERRPAVRARLEKSLVPAKSRRKVTHH